MANPFYSPDEQRANRVNDLFAYVAPRYDLMNDLQSFGLHRLWKRGLVRMAGVQKGDTALDLCCGTGDIAFALGEQDAEVVGLDFTQPMLEVAETRRQKLSDAALKGRVQFVRGDAQQISFPDNTFSVTTVGYGLRNLASWETGLDEMHRVTRPGGRLLVLEFGKPDNPVLRWLYFSYLRLVVPLLGWLFCRNAAAYAYILESLKHYPAQKGVAARMRKLGMEKVKIVNILGGVMSINYGEKACGGSDRASKSVSSQEKAQ
jgi:demethylmenaquinone methyltransferase/2-methoxy-6-polyprenyl-1,4-benzoquinol methylase